MLGRVTQPSNGRSMSHDSSAGAPPPSPHAILSRLPEKRASWYTKEVAHTFAAGQCDRRGRLLGLLVVVLTTVIGTSTFAALQHNPSQAAKLTVAVLAVASALAASLKEFFQYGKDATEHLKEAASYGSLKDRADDLDDTFRAGRKPDLDANTELVALERQAEALDNTPPMVVGRVYRKAERWIRDKEATAGIGH